MKIGMAEDRLDYHEAIVIVNGQELTSKVNPNSFRTSPEPTISAIQYALSRQIGLHRRRSDEFIIDIKIGSEGFVCLLMRSKKKYSLNGIHASREVILKALSRTIFLSCFDDREITLYNKLEKGLKIPENVQYAFENRAPFHWFEDLKKIEASLNVMQISDTECAMEISDGVWGNISIKNLNTYLNYYRLGNKRGSWKRLHPCMLWERLMGEEPTTSQLKLMVAFLRQNRTQDIVESRAEELLVDLADKYPDRIKYILKPDKTMFVRGKLADWKIVEGGMKHLYQSVSTYVFRHTPHTRGGKACTDGYWAGPICIDNMTQTTSMGDQMASRAIVLLNDNVAVKRISTIANYLETGHTEGQNEIRINFDVIE
jgi:hypothetical protein